MSDSRNDKEIRAKFHLYPKLQKREALTAEAWRR